MKKVRIMLTAITVFAIVGGALAFKAKKFVTPNVYCSTFTGPTCQLASPNLQTTIVAGAPARNPCSGGFYFTTNTCPITTSFTTVGTGAIPVYDLQEG